MITEHYIQTECMCFMRSHFEKRSTQKEIRNLNRSFPKHNIFVKTIDKAEQPDKTVIICLD